MPPTSAEDFSERLRAVVESGKATIESPEWQEHAAKLREQHARWDAERVEQTRHAAWEAAGIPMLFRAHLDNPDDTDGIRAARSFERDAALALVLGGTKGTGKSFAAAYLCAHGSGLYVSAMDMARAGNYDDAFWNQAIRARMLAIDELGKEPLDAKGWFLAALYSLLEKRIGAKRKTVITTNLAGKAFQERYCSGEMEPLGDRLRAYGRFVKIVGESLRRTTLTPMVSP